MTSQVETRSHDVTVPEADAPRLVGLLAEFTDVDSTVRAARTLRDAGYTCFDVHSPFPIHGIDTHMGIKPTILPWLVLGGGLTGMISGILLTGWTMGVDYQYFISGKPLFSWPAFIPVIFEMTILFAALTAVFGMLLLNRLPMLYNPLLKHPRFARVTNDRFLVIVGTDDSKFDEPETARLLQGTRPVAVERLED